MEDLAEVPTDRAILFIVGVDADHAVICSRIRSQYPLAFIVAVADESNPRSLASALEDGANAAIFNSVSPDALVSTLQAVINGKLILIDARLWPLEIRPKAEDRADDKADERLSPPLAGGIAWDAADEVQEPLTIKLSAREIAILERIVQGDSNKHVARFFKIAEPTVKAHVKTIFRKIGANNRTQAAIWALNNRVFDQACAATADLPILLSDGTGS